MATDWKTKEKMLLSYDILVYGDQPESWSSISNNLSRKFQAKKDGRYSIKNCKQEYKYLVNRYKSEWIEHGSSNGLKLPIAKYIWKQLRTIYQAELMFQLNESRKKLTEFCLRLETAVNIKPNITEPTLPPSITDVATPVVTPQEIEQQEDRTPIKMEIVSEPIRQEPDILPNEPIQSTSPAETNSVSSTSDNFKEQTIILPQVSEQPQIKEESFVEISNDTILTDNNHQLSSTISPNAKQNFSTTSQDISQPLLIDSSSPNILPDQQPSISQITISNPPLTPSTSSATIPESVSSSRSTSRTSSETKTDVVKIIPTTTPKYHVYFSPKNSISNNLTINKNKVKRKAIDEIKDENESESINQQEHPTSLVPSSSTEPSKISSTTAPMTRRSINTRSVPNSAAEQEEERTRRFSAMLTENPNSWQSQSMAIIQYMLAHKQGYLFEYEITDEIAPKYHQFIRHPIALDTIRKILESNSYQTKEYFKRDIFLMLYNAMKYNPRHHHVHRSAKHLFLHTAPLFHLSSQEIHGQIVTRNIVSSVPTTTTNDTPVAKRQRIK